MGDPGRADGIICCLAFYSNPNETLLSPFAGVGSEIVGAVGDHRRGIGIELKQSYYRQMERNVEYVLANGKALVGTRGMLEATQPEALEPEPILELGLSDGPA